MTCSADVDRRDQNVPRALALLNIRMTGRAVQQAMRTVMKFPVRKPTLRDVGRSDLPIGQRGIRLLRSWLRRDRFDLVAITASPRRLVTELLVSMLLCDRLGFSDCVENSLRLIFRQLL